MSTQSQSNRSVVWLRNEFESEYKETLRSNQVLLDSVDVPRERQPLGKYAKFLTWYDFMFLIIRTRLGRRDFVLDLIFRQFQHDRDNAIYIVDIDDSKIDSYLTHPLILVDATHPRMEGWTTILCDGSRKINGTGAYGFVILKENTKILLAAGARLLLHFSTEAAELWAILRALRKLRQKYAHVDRVMIWSDSTSVVDKLNGKVSYQNPNPKSTLYQVYETVFSLLSKFDEYEIKHHFREANMMADLVCKTVSRDENPDLDELQRQMDKDNSTTFYLRVVQNQVKVPQQFKNARNGNGN